MPNAILIACPECGKQLRMPPHLQGKKIRCKACGHAFTAIGRRKGAGDEAITAQAQSGAHSDLVADYNPYAVVEESLAPRCPHCAGELESSEAVICLHCGYNTQTRERQATKKTYQTTGMDYFLWLLPGIACALTVVAMIGAIIFLIVWLRDVVDANKDAWWAFAPRAMSVWGTIFCLFVIFFTGMFAIKRLIFHPVPPEKMKR